MNILGIDPGLRTTGFGIIEISQRDVSVVKGGTIQTGPVSKPLAFRLNALYDGVCALFQRYNLEALALEQLYSHYAHPVTAILMGHARGVICLAASKNGVPVFDYASTQIKSCITGNGHASKEQMQKAIKGRLNLDELPTPNDIADALAVAICHHWITSSPVAAAVSAKMQQKALKG